MGEKAFSQNKSFYQNNPLLQSTLSMHVRFPKASFSRKWLNKWKKTIYRKTTELKGEHHADEAAPEEGPLSF